MKKLLVLSYLLVFGIVSVFAQNLETSNSENKSTVMFRVSVAGTDVSKEYPNGNRITYFLLDGMPTNENVQQMIVNEVLKNPKIKRLKIYKDGVTCMYEALIEVTEEFIVAEINKALENIDVKNISLEENPPKNLQNEKSVLEKNASEKKASKTVIDKTVKHEKAGLEKEMPQGYIKAKTEKE